MMINGVLRASGDAKTPMNVMMLATYRKCYPRSTVDLWLGWVV